VVCHSVGDRQACVDDTALPIVAYIAIDIQIFEVGRELLRSGARLQEVLLWEPVGVDVDLGHG
jgi:hypothetical protein